MGVYLQLRRRAARIPAVQRGRQSRYEFFVRVCDVQPSDSILDVGSGPGTLLERHNRENPIVALDLAEKSAGPLSRYPNVEFVHGDACKMPFADRQFDVAFSNSVVEHIPPAQWQQYADEIRRVSGRYFVQTPNRWFPVEPHFMLPFAQFLPRRARRALERWFNDGEPINLLDETALRQFFPDAKIYRERMLGLTKSLMAVRH